MTTPRKCRIYPESRNGLYYLAHLWPTKRAMLDYFRRAGLSHSRRTQALCSTHWRVRFRAGHQSRPSPEMGELHFYRGRLDAEIVAHEIGHAAQGWARRIELDLVEGPHVSPREERYCYALGRMVCQLNNRFYAWGAYGAR